MRLKLGLPLLSENLQLQIVSIHHYVLILLVSQLSIEPKHYRIIAKLKSPLLHHLHVMYLVNLSDVVDLLILDALQADVVPRGLIVHTGGVKMYV